MFQPADIHTIGTTYIEVYSEDNINKYFNLTLYFIISEPLQQSRGGFSSPTKAAMAVLTYREGINEH